MGKGDQKSKKGKIARGTFGKTRMKKKNMKTNKAPVINVAPKAKTKAK